MLQPVDDDRYDNEVQFQAGLDEDDLEEDDELPDGSDDDDEGGEGGAGQGAHAEADDDEEDEQVYDFGDFFDPFNRKMVRFQSATKPHNHTMKGALTY